MQGGTTSRKVAGSLSAAAATTPSNLDELIPRAAAEAATAATLSRERGEFVYFVLEALESERAVCGR